MATLSFLRKSIVAWGHIYLFPPFRIEKIVIFTTFHSAGYLRSAFALFKYVDGLVACVRMWGGEVARFVITRKICCCLPSTRAGYAWERYVPVCGTDVGAGSVTALIKHLSQPINGKDDGILMRIPVRCMVSSHQWHDYEWRMQRFVDSHIIQKFSIFRETRRRRIARSVAEHLKLFPYASINAIHHGP